MKHIVVINRKPELSGKTSAPDGAINGNGDLGIILGNCENGLRVYISKCDLWDAVENKSRGGMKPLGYIDIPVPENLYNNYHVEQDMDCGEIRCEFKDGKKLCGITLRVNKTENSIMTEFYGNVSAEPELCVFGGETSGEKGEFTESGCKGIFRSFSGEERVFETHGYAVMKKVCDGKYYTFVATNHDTDEPKKFAFSKANEMTAEKFEALKQAHYTAWENFWRKSSFETDDRELEIGWYASQYLLAGCAGNIGFPPGLYANFITVENPSWHSDYHLNYNYQAPFYAACSSNHVELTDCYHVPLEEFMNRGRTFAQKFGCRGIIYPVGMMPKGICSELTPELKLWFERLFLGQRSNAIHPADIMVFRWNATRDTDYAREHAYPYLKACLEFFEDYMTFENGCFSVKQDAAHEVPYYKTDFNPKKYKRYINDTNNALTLGLLRLCIPAAIDMSVQLGIDEEKREIWKNILDKLSPFATFNLFFRKVFRYTEKGQMWNGNGDVGLQHIYPCGCVGLGSDKKMLKIARNTFRAKEKYCWLDGNAVSSFFPMAARLGKDGKTIIKRLKELNRKIMLPNMLYDFGAGCLENCSIFANTLNEMVMQSHEGVIRLFPSWDRSRDCRFEKLRADGAFLVSSEIESGEIKRVKLVSEAGQTLKMENPYSLAKITVDGKSFTEKDRMITIKTTKGMKICITD